MPKLINPPEVHSPGGRYSHVATMPAGARWVHVSGQVGQDATGRALDGFAAQADQAWRNVLADDGEHHYVIVSLKALKADPVFTGNRVSVSAGYSLPRLCIDAARHGLAGIEGLNGIPGTVGGALWMNAGAFGQEIGTVVESVRVASRGRVTEIPGREVQWNYRHTSFREGELLLGTTLALHPDDQDAINQRMEKAKSQRLATQPHGARSAGCFFKNAPSSPVGTGKIIDELGMKGTRRGGAIVSPKHANFIVTEGEDAKAADALELAEEIRQRVKREHCIDLEYEVELWSSVSEPRAVATGLPPAEDEKQT